MSTELLSLFSPTMSVIRVIVMLIVLVGCTWGAVLLIMDSMKHKGFAKVIRIISAVVRFLMILFGIIERGTTTTISSIIGGIGLITTVWGGVLLLVQSGRVKGLAKVIRIICGILMIGMIVLSIMLAVIVSMAILSSIGA